LGVFTLDQIADVGAARSQNLKLITKVVTNKSRRILVYTVSQKKRAKFETV